MKSFFSITGPVQCGLNALASHMQAQAQAHPINLVLLKQAVKLTIEEHALPLNERSDLIDMKMTEAKRIKLPNQDQYEKVKHFIDYLSSQRELNLPYVLHLFV